MTLRLYNSLTRKLEEFKPLKEGLPAGSMAGRVGIYVCGPTVYSHAHLGHAKSYVSFDVLVRYLRYLGYNVSYVQNITDVGHLTDDADEGEDKIAKAAKKEKKHPMALAEFYTRSYFEDMDKLNCLRPDISPRASGHIVEQIELVKKLLEKGYAYEVNGSVYFDVSKFKDYGKLSGRNVDDMQAGARVEVSADKKHPADFALWKKAEPNHIMQWPSPWGPGFPGWHLECSVMSTKYLGQPFDIHGGGLENQFPHHECEIAQSEAANGVQFARYWVHNNMVTVDGQKMGKSLNNFITLKQVFSDSPELKHERLSRKYDPLAVRQLILNSHYRSPIDFSDAALSAAQSGYENITPISDGLDKAQREQEVVTKAAIRVRQKWNIAPEGPCDKKVAEQLEKLTRQFEEAMNDDLNTSVALSVIFDLVRLTNSLLANNDTTKETLNSVDEKFRKLGGDVLGIVEQHYGKVRVVVDYKMTNELVKNLIEQRNDARNRKDFVAADAIRNKLSEIGIVLEDTPGGTIWRFK
jgi:cysteinyl-tRNA synthetase